MFKPAIRISKFVSTKDQLISAYTKEYTRTKDQLIGNEFALRQMESYSSARNVSLTGSTRLAKRYAAVLEITTHARKEYVRISNVLNVLRNR